MTNMNTDVLTPNEAVEFLSFYLKLDEKAALTEFWEMVTISMDDALDKVMNMRKAYLEQQGFKPYIDAGRWRGYVYYVENGKRKRKAIAAPTIKEAQNKAIAFYREHDPFFYKKPMTLLTLYPEFIAARKDDNISETTTLRDYCDWKRFLENDPLSRIPLKDLTYMEFARWFKKKLKEGLPAKNKKSDAPSGKETEKLPFTTSQAKSLRTLLTNMFQFAVDNGYMDENLSAKLGRFRYAKYCQNKLKSDAEQVYQDNEPTEIMDLAYKRFFETRNFAYLGVILLFLLDVRSGELVALKYSDLEDRKGQIHIRRQEVPNKVYDEKRERYTQKGFTTVEHTKTWQTVTLCFQMRPKKQST